MMLTQAGMAAFLAAGAQVRLLTADGAVTAPVSLSNFQKYFGLAWGPFAAAATLFVLPLLVFTWKVQPQLVRGLAARRA